MNSSIHLLQQIRNDLLKYKADDTPTIIDDTTNTDIKSFLNNLSIGDGSFSLIRGVASLRESILREILILEKQAEGVNVKKYQNSSNAPYFISLYTALQDAKAPIVAMNANFSSGSLRNDYSKAFRGENIGAKKTSAKNEIARVDIVANGGREWIKLSSIKPHRLAAELDELGFASESESEVDCGVDSSHSMTDTSVSAPMNGKLFSEQTLIPNLILLSQLLLRVAKSNPFPLSGEIPRITLRLTRLDRKRDGSNPRVKSLFERMEGMGIQLSFGECKFNFDDSNALKVESQNGFSNLERVMPRKTIPTKDIALDLSALIALISDTAHSPLPSSIFEAHFRFRPTLGSQGRENGTFLDDDEDGSPVGGNFHPSGEEIHRKALHAQLVNEMDQPLIPHIQSSLQRSCFGTGESAGLVEIRFWTTKDSLELFEDILSKVSGPGEARRAKAVLKGDADAFWIGSRLSEANPRIPLLPLNIYPSEPLVEVTSDDHSLPSVRVSKDAFTPLATVLSTHVPGLTPHTRSLLLSAARKGHTILTANKKSVKTALRVVRSVGLPPLTAGDGDTEMNSDRKDFEGEPAVFWVVEPRSLAELMRSDGLVEEGIGA